VFTYESTTAVFMVDEDEGEDSILLADVTGSISSLGGG
jgi:hypothetical protein